MFVSREREKRPSIERGERESSSQASPRVFIPLPPHLISGPNSTISPYAPSHPRYEADAFEVGRSLPLSARSSRTPRASVSRTALQRRSQLASPLTGVPLHSARSPGTPEWGASKGVRSPSRSRSSSVKNELSSSGSDSGVVVEHSSSDYGDDFVASHDMSQSPRLSPHRDEPILQSPQSSSYHSGHELSFEAPPGNSPHLLAPRPYSPSEACPSNHQQHQPSSPVYNRYSRQHSSSSTNLSPAGPAVHRPPSPKNSVIRLSVSPFSQHFFPSPQSMPARDARPRARAALAKRPMGKEKRQKAKESVVAVVESSAVSGDDYINMILAQRLSRAVVLNAQQDVVAREHAHALAAWERDTEDERAGKLGGDSGGAHNRGVGFARIHRPKSGRPLSKFAPLSSRRS